jgi:hypothetical protein
MCYPVVSPFVCQDPSNPLLPKGFEKLTQVLIDANADVNICNKIGQTALHRASQVSGGKGVERKGEVVGGDRILEEGFLKKVRILQVAQVLLDVHCLATLSVWACVSWL